MRDIINNSNTDEIVEASEMAVHYAIGRQWNNSASYPGEPPVKLLKECSTFLAKPIASVINESFLEQSFLKMWKAAYVRVITKVLILQSCDQPRPISITPILAKVAEAFV